ncbi:MAG: nitroreductase family protein [Pseudomonadales bacterium]|jgi:nitroreductase|nr:nitroreductase family protein [Pseudomonadales bacterium]MDP6472791.1 nitroreductase family protein [Pseudomonadales bacterium]MDP6828004.1 nitroreductase family protein [Pseudomonadales bacterium]MDP6972903.1 nitroreductase family protein [Pseudomonadales bacterium]
MSDLSLTQAMSTLRAVRRLRPDPIPEEVLERVLQAAAWAPTGGNAQPWRIVLVRDADAKARLGTLYAAQWTEFAKGYEARFEALPEEDVARERRTLDAGNYLAEHLHEAPVIAVFCFNPKMMAITDIKQPRVSVVGGGSVYPAVQNLLLAARAEGLGCVLTTLLCQVEPEVREILAIPEPWGTAAAIPLGYPIGTGHGPIRRRAVGSLVFEDTFGNKRGSP